MTNLENIEEIKNLTEEERAVFLKTIQQFSMSGESKLYEDLKYADYNEIPVTIEQFVDDYNYLGNAWHDNDGNSKLYPYWRKELNKIFPDNLSTSVNNAIFSGSRGRGKSEICVLIMAYQLYRVMCLKDPIAHFHLKPTEKIVFAFMNIKLALAEEIGITKFQNTIQSSPWFMQNGELSGRTNKIWTPKKFNNQVAIDIKIGSQADDLIGLPCYTIFFDEVSFQRNQDIEKQKQKAYNAIDTAIGGMKTRFVYKGINPTLLLLASSKRSEKSFLEEHMKKKLESEKENVYISDGSVWEVKPKGTYKNEMFRVALGNKYLPSLVIPDNEDSSIYIDKGYKILEVPIDFKPDFLDDIDRALCDFAGISSSEISKYISAQAVKEIIVDTYQNPFTREIIEVGNGPDDKAQYCDFFDLSKVARNYMSKPLFVHLDMSISGDMTGISGVWITGKKVSDDPNNQSKDLFFTLAFSVSIRAPKGRQVSFEKNRNFIRWLKEQGFKIKKVTSDTFQSYDLQQQLKSEGFDCDILSVDRVDTNSHICVPYQYFRSTIYEKRLQMFKDDELFSEIIDLERNINTGKVDHPDGGRKDACDSFCLGSDTRIYLLDGPHKTIKQLYDEKADNVNNWVLAYNVETNNLEPVKISDVVNNGYREELLKLYLDNGEEITCTPDHKLLTRNGDYIEAQNSLNVSLMPFNYETRVMFKNREYPYVYIPQADGTNRGAYLHKLVCENTHKSERIYKEQTKGNKEFIVMHHKDCNRFNNTPENLEYLTNVEHSLKHTALNTSDKKRMQLSLANKRLLNEGHHPFQSIPKQQLAENGRNSLIKYNKSDKHRKTASENNKRLAAMGLLGFQLKKENAHTSEANLKRHNTCMQRYGGTGFESAIIQEKCRKSCLANNDYDNPFHSKEKQHEMRINKLKKAYNKILNEFNLTENDYMSLFDFKVYCYILHISGVSSSVSDIIESNLNIDVNNYNEKDYKALRNKGNCVNLFLKETHKDSFTYNEFLDYYNQKFSEYDKDKGSSNFRFRFKDVPSYTDIVKLGFKIRNHRVIKIEKVSGDYVYDLKLDNIHNFAIMAGIFVHNCGALFEASKHAEEFAFDYGESFDTTLKVNNEITSFEGEKKQITLDFEEQLKSILNPIKQNNNSQDKPKENESNTQTTKKENVYKPINLGFGDSQPYKPSPRDGIIVW